MDEITVRAVTTSRVGQLRPKSQQEMLFTLLTKVLQVPVVQIVPLDNVHPLSGGSIGKVYIHLDSVLYDTSHIGCQLLHGFTMVTDSKCFEEGEIHYDSLNIYVYCCRVTSDL